MKIIVGLGNPGPQYAANRHNIGFMAVDCPTPQASIWALVEEVQVADCRRRDRGEKVLLMKPQTFMNLSGDAVGEAMRFYKLTPGDIIAIHDELDLPAGKVSSRSAAAMAAITVSSPSTPIAAATTSACAWALAIGLQGTGSQPRARRFRERFDQGWLDD